MPTLYIGKTERVCCNCRSFTFCQKPLSDGAMFTFPPNMGHCKEIDDLTKATKRVCKQFNSRVKEKKQ